MSFRIWPFSGGILTVLSVFFFTAAVHAEDACGTIVSGNQIRLDSNSTVIGLWRDNGAQPIYPDSNFDHVCISCSVVGSTVATFCTGTPIYKCSGSKYYTSTGCMHCGYYDWALPSRDPFIYHTVTTCQYCSDSHFKPAPEGQCVRCPQNGQTNSNGPNNSVANCYIPSGGTGSDNIGDFKYVTNCFY